MSEPQYVTCLCQRCDGGIEFDTSKLTDGNSILPCPHCGLETKLSIPAQASALPKSHPQTDPPAIQIPPHEDKQQPAHKKTRRSASRLTNLTEGTIRATTQKGDTPLHRAAKNGQINEIPPHLLTTELFTIKNLAGETPVHAAAKHGHLDQIPPAFLTIDTLAVKTGGGTYTTGSGYAAQTETPLHIAVRCGHADQIPKMFLTPEFLSIEASGYRLTLLHYLANIDRLDLVPDIYAQSEMWNLRDYRGQTPRDLVANKAADEAYVAGVRAQPATEKQKAKLRFFGCTWDEGITKGQAHDAIDECIRLFPEKETEYYDRPATEEQLASIREINQHPDCGPDEPFYDFDEEGPLTYGKAKDVLQEWEWAQREKTNEAEEAYQRSDGPLIDELGSRLWMDDFPDVTRDQVVKALALAKSRSAGKSERPDDEEIQDTLEELYPQFRTDDHNRSTYQCPQCGVIYKARLTEIDAFNHEASKPFSKEDFIQSTIPCPHCGQPNQVTALKVCKYICPHCSKECLTSQSQTGQAVTHFRACGKDFIATPTEATIGEPRIRIMQYADQTASPAEQPNQKGNKEWFTKRDRPSQIEAKAKARLAQEGLQNVEVIVGSADGKIIINLDAKTDAELVKAAKILGIKSQTIFSGLLLKVPRR